MQNKFQKDKENIHFLCIVKYILLFENCNRQSDKPKKSAAI